MKKVVVWDMDASMNKFYEVEGWLEDIHNENTRPYEICEPLWDMKELKRVLLNLKEKGWLIAVTSWLAKGASKEYDNEVRKAKLNWLKKYEFPYDEIHLVKYGTTKANCTRRHGGYQILIDDNKEIRKGWTLGATLDPTSENVIEILKSL